MNGTNRKFLTEAEAAAYLNISQDKVVSLITNGEITEYIQTDTGYSIDIDDLDSWFENEVYKRTMEKNAQNATTTKAENRRLFT
jgi:excisionase family DNA binding protein